ncbi:hypothetical protein KP509_16G031400 [Ceratopteris richardii]|uniref:PROP1-like PPR domain-containing protein n=1 Tax=Ceratopteris richardii TaxID=49495 RepID=A0A8T2T3C2_CERRI|nr:hypothetical protein KP509_16G031400 [Ceratopteris richardii]
MAHMFSYRFTELINSKTVQPENLHACYYGENLLTYGSRWTERVRCSPAATLRNSACPPAPGLRYDCNISRDSATIWRTDIASLEPRQRLVSHETAGSSLCNRDADAQDVTLAKLHISTNTKRTWCSNKNAKDAGKACSAGDTDDSDCAVDFQVTMAADNSEISCSQTYNPHTLSNFPKNEKKPANDPYDVRASSGGRTSAEDLTALNRSSVQNRDEIQKNSKQTECIGQESSLDVSSSSFASLASGIPAGVTATEILSSAASLTESEFSSILHMIKPPSKIKELFNWMKLNCTALDVHYLVFAELVKRKEWAVLEHILKDEEAVQPDLTTFKVIMPLFRRHLMLEDAYFAYQQMSGIGVECSAASLDMVLLFIQFGHVEKAKQIYMKLQEVSEECLEVSFLSQLNSYVQCAKVKEAEGLMKFLKGLGISLDISVYNLMITVNGKAGEYMRAKEWFSCIEKDGLSPNEASFRSIIGACGRAGNFYDAFQFYDRMISLHFSPNLVNYNTLIHLHRKVDHQGRILELLSNMKTIGCLPNSATLNSVIKVYERYGRIYELPEALQLLMDAGWKPNETCFGLLIRAYIRCNMVDEAMDIFTKLCAVAMVDEIMCHNLICMCKSVGRYDEAIHVFNEICRVQNVKPSLRTRCAIIDVFSSKGSIKEGEAIFMEIRKCEDIDAATYNVVLNMYLRAGILEKAAGILRDALQNKELVPDSYLFHCMLKVCAKCGLQNEAIQVYYKIKSSQIVWTESLFNGVIHSCGRVLPSEEVVKLFNAMMTAKMPVNNVTCNILIDIFGKAGLLEKARFVVRLAQKQGVQDSITFSTMIDAYGKHKKFDEMESLLIEMLNEGFKDCVEGYNSVLDAYGDSGQITNMEKTLVRMRMTGCSPNLTTFNILLKVYGREGLIEDLQDVLKEIKMTGLELDHYSFTTLIHAYGSANMLDRSLEYFHGMLKAGFEPDLAAYTCIVSVLRAGGFEKESNRLFNWVSREGPV